MSEKVLQMLIDNYPIFLAGVLSIAGVAIGSILSGINAFRSEARKVLLEERAKRYFDFYKVVDKVTGDRKLVLSKDYFQKLATYKSDMKLLASNRTYHAYENFYNFAHSKVIAFSDYCDENNPYNDHSKMRKYINAEGEVDIKCLVDNIDLDAFENEKSEYISLNTPSVEELQKYIYPLFSAMRNDLGNDLT